jgi:pyruvate,water dikinase
VVFSRGAGSAQQAISKLAAEIRKQQFGWVKSRLVRFFASRARQLMGMRESPKFFAVRMFWLVRREFLKTGLEFASAGDLEKPDDLFFLTFSELQDFASQKELDWKGLVATRRLAYQREILRKQIPRLILSDGRAFYEGVNSNDLTDESLSGSPVSPGSVSGKVRVVFNPTGAGLLPGEILVCPGTDPSWTPLFLSAAGLVMEVGGMMTHGAVVAREYGIPAIVGVDQATNRLQTGQLIRIDGSSGQIQILDEESA